MLRGDWSIVVRPSQINAGLNWYRANCSLQQFAMTNALPKQKIKVPILGVYSTDDKFLTEEQMTASKQ